MAHVVDAFGSQMIVHRKRDCLEDSPVEAN